MNVLPRAFSQEGEGKLRKLTFLRLVVATVVIGAAIMVLKYEYAALSVVALYSMLGVIYLSTGSVYLAFRTGVPFRPLLWIQICVDLVVLTLIVHYSGGSVSYFSILYILPIIVGGIYFQIGGGLITALAATSFFFIYSILELGGRLESNVAEFTSMDQGVYQPLLRCYLYMTVFVFTGLISGYVSRHMKHKGEELADREKELRRIQLNTDSIIKNMSSGLIVTSMTGEIITLNRAAVSILGLCESGSVEGRLIEDVIPHMPSLRRELMLVLETGDQRQRHELDVRRKDGTDLPLGISISILRGDGGEKKGVIALFQDLTEVSRMREQIRQSDKMAAIGELSAAIAHDIRAPLASICGSIDVLVEELDLNDDNKKLMELITKESDRLDRIITDFLEYARMRKPEFEPIDVEQCLDEMLLLLRNSSTVRRDISMRVVNEAKGVRINADEEQIKQVFLNLALNACDAMCEGGSLTITIKRTTARTRDNREPEECIWIDFHNNGQEIAEDVLSRVFEPFYTTKQGGSGLGLAIASRIVESHSGLIKVVSSTEEGTTFSVVIPACLKPVNPHAEKLQEEFISF
jgi:two-component system sensor histidine kinase PilS (NtrC family)